MPVVTRRSGGEAGRAKPPSILWGVLGSLLKIYAIAVLAVILDVPGTVADVLEALAVLAEHGALRLARLPLPNPIRLVASVPNALLGAALLATGVAAWIAGSKFLDRGWKGLTGRWGRGARIALLVFNAVGTALWILGLVALVYPFVAAYVSGALGSTAEYLNVLVETARSVHIALIAFALSALTPAVAGLIHLTQAWGRGGRLAAILLALGGLVYAANAIVVYMAWRGFASSVLASLPHTASLKSITSVLTPQLEARILEGLASIAAMFTTYLRIAMAAYALWALGFLAAWLDYRRASRGT